jgi:hypothetical protein
MLGRPSDPGSYGQRTSDRSGSRAITSARPSPILSCSPFSVGIVRAKNSYGRPARTTTPGSRLASNSSHQFRQYAAAKRRRLIRSITCRMEGLVLRLLLKLQRRQGSIVYSQP